MTLTGALFSGVSGLNAQGNVLGVIGDNISNSSTIGFKSGTSVFESLVTGTGAAGTGAGVISGTRLNIDQQGLIQNTGVSTDIAISGGGFFVVSDTPGGEAFYTRAGSFRQNDLGFFVNSAGYNLLAWPLDNEERLPGEEGNANNTPAQLLDSLEPVNVRDISGLAFATTSVELGINLDASEAIVGGASGTLTPASLNNANASTNTLLTPSTGSIELGDILQVTAGPNAPVGFTYGGFVQSRNIQATNIFGVGLPGDRFTDIGTAAGQIADGDSFTITGASVIATDTTTTATFTFEADGTPDTGSGEFNSLETLVEAINAVTGLNARIGGEATGVSRVYISSDNANDALTFANSATNTGNLGNNDSQSLLQSLGLFNLAAGSGRFNTLEGLANLVNEAPDLSASLSNSSIVIATTNPEYDITFANSSPGTTVVATEDIVPVSTNNTGATAATLLTPTTGAIELGDTLDIAVNAGAPTSYTYGGLVQGGDIQAGAGFFGVTASNLTFTDIGVGAGQIADGDAFTITAASLTGPATFTFTTSGTPDASAGEFDSLDSLAAAINAATGLTARISGEAGGVSRLYIGTADANEAITFANAVGNTGNGGADDAQALYQSLGLADIAGGTNRFNSLGGLASLIDGETNLSASVTAGTLTVNAVSTADTITFSSTTAGTGVLTTEFGVVTTAISAVTTPGTGNLNNEFGITTNTIERIYDIANNRSIASGSISADFSRNVRVFDSLGEGHDLRIAFVKADENVWLVEVFAANPEELNPNETYVDGILASGRVNFNGDGSLASISNALQSAINVRWANGAIDSNITLDLGTAGPVPGTAGATQFGQTDGLSQNSGDYNVRFTEQNGASVGLLSSVEIDAEGFIIANFSNGESRRIFRIPLASFPNPNGLFAVSGNVFSPSDASGDFSLLEAGQSGVGTLSVASLEQANTELATQLTQLIVAQRAYQSNTRVITAADELLEELNRL